MAIIHYINSNILGSLAAQQQQQQQQAGLGLLVFSGSTAPLFNGQGIMQIMQNYADMQYVPIQTTRTEKISTQKSLDLRVGESIMNIPFDAWYHLAKIGLSRIDAITGDTVGQFLAASTIHSEFLVPTKLSNLIDSTTKSPNFPLLKFYPNFRNAGSNSNYGSIYATSASFIETFNFGYDLSGQTVSLGVYDSTFSKLSTFTGVTNSSGDVTIIGTMPTLMTGNIYYFRIDGLMIFSRSMYSSLRTDIMAQTIFSNLYSSFIGA